MTGSDAAGRAEAVRDRYREVFGIVPAGIEDRLAVAEAAGRMGAVEVVEALRRALLTESPLEPRLQQLVHFAQLVALGHEGPARLHAKGAQRAGATLADLVGVAETSLVSAGMPAYALAIEIIAELRDADESPSAQGRVRTITPPSGRMWDRRFAEEGWPTDPDPFLVDLAETLPAGRGLDLGSGPGRNSLWLAAKGWDMTLVDASGVGVDQAAAAADAMSVTVTTVHADVADWQPGAALFDLVIVANLHPGPDALATLLCGAATALRPGGHLYVVGHHLANLGHHGPPDPERLLTEERLRVALPAGLEVQLLETRFRLTDHGHREDHGDGDPERDMVVLAWATKPRSHRKGSR